MNDDARPDANEPDLDLEGPPNIIIDEGPDGGPWLVAVVAALAFVAFLFAGELDAQVYRVDWNGYAASLEDGGWERLTQRGAEPSWVLEATVHGGELVVMNGALEHYVGTVTGPLRVWVDDELLVDEPAVTIHDGCGWVWHHEPLAWSPPDQRSADMLAWYFAGGPADPDLAVCRAWTWGGPNPDPKDAGQTGSERVAWARWPLGMAIQHLRAAGETGSAEQWAEVARWGAVEPWRRSQNYHHAEPGSCCWSGEGEGPVGRPYRTAFHPDALIGVGYRAPGGFFTTYGATELFGRVDEHGKPVKAGGRWWVDRQHADIAGGEWVAAATGSWAAARACRNVVETLQGHHRRSGFYWPNNRAIGWPVRCLALELMRTGNAELLEYVDELDVHLASERGVYGEGSGKRWHLVEARPMGGHLDASPALEGFLEAVGYQGDVDDLLEWDSTWQDSIAGLSFTFMAAAVEGTGASELTGRGRVGAWNAHALWAGAVVFVTAVAPGFNVDTLAFGPPDGVEGVPFSNARSARSNLFSNVWHNWVVGVGAGTVVPFAEDLARRLEGDQPGQAAHVRALGDTVALYCYRQGWWDSPTPNRFLLDRGHTWAGRWGWKGKGWDPDEEPSDG